MLAATPVIPAAGDALGALRAATLARHARVDAAMPLSRPCAGLAEYRAHLLLLREWLLPLLAALEGLPAAPQGYAAGIRSRCQQIDADLLRSGGLPAVSSAAPRPLQAPAAYWWGVVYVIEGAQLGAAALQRRLAPALAGFAPAYLAGDAAGPGPRWRQFLADLAAQVRSSSEIRDCCRGACAAFDALLALLPAGETQA